MDRTVTYADWIAVDWGTSNLRSWAMSHDGRVKDTACSDAGMGKLKRDEFEPTLMSLIEPWLRFETTQVVVCGMAGARQGWFEAPYVSAPCAPSSQLVPVPSTDKRLNVGIIPGIKQTKSPDVMRGEETQVAGFLSENPDFDGIVCLPGTHSKWVHISAREVVSFQTFLTGEMFDLLTNHSVLKHSTQSDDWDDESFSTAVNDALSKPERIAADLFRLRADDLLNATPKNTSRARLSGLLIGAELAAARPFWLGQNVALLGAGGIANLYTKALSHVGVTATFHSDQEMTIAGLKLAYESYVK